MTKCEVLKAIRQELKYSQASVAQSIGVSTRTLYNYEHGETVIPNETFENLCKVYEIPPDLLCKFIEERAKDLQSIDEILKPYHSYSEYEENPMRQRSMREYLDRLRVKEHAVRETDKITIHMKYFIADTNIEESQRILCKRIFQTDKRLAKTVASTDEAG